MGLYAEVHGDPAAHPPLVLLHGFGGVAPVWREVIARLPAGQPVLAFDLPGHGRSLGVEPGGAGRMARAVLADLDQRGVTRFHLAGHSLGGAAASLIALRAPERIASLTLLAPGGFGPEINGAALADFAAARTVADLRLALVPMAASGFEFAEDLLVKVAAARFPAGAMEALRTVYASLFVKGDASRSAQGTLPIGSLDTLECPVILLWGTDDQILPVRHSHGLPANCQIQQLQGTGHMLPDEAPEAVAAAIMAGVGGGVLEQ
nr:alpha/beta fold hydrolase [uncultured Gellertiella sp.]